VGTVADRVGQLDVIDAFASDLEQKQEGLQ
jgi:hypothetical protein